MSLKIIILYDNDLDKQDFEKESSKNIPVMLYLKSSTFAVGIDHWKITDCKSWILIQIGSYV